ncbi:MAG: acyltransferase family protein [Pseudomonadota bacterium]
MIASLVGLAMIAFASSFYSDAMLFPGEAALLPCIGAALVIWPRVQMTFADKALSIFPLRWIGLASYSLYLWHWPVLVFYRHYALGEMPDGVTTAALIALSVALAFFSLFFIERPARRVPAPAPRVIRVGFAGASCLVALGGAILFVDGAPQRVSQEARGLSEIDRLWAWECPSHTRLTGDTKARCTAGKPYETAARKAVVWGDSHAEHLMPILDVLGKKYDTSIVLLRTCSPAYDEEVYRLFPTRAWYRAHCARQNRAVLDVLKRHSDISMVITSAFATHDLTNMRYERDGAGVVSGAPALAEGFQRRIAETTGPSRAFVLVGNVPRWNVTGREPHACLLAAHSTLISEPCDTRTLAIPRTAFMAEAASYFAMLDTVAGKNPQVRSLAGGRGLRRDAQCISVIDGTFIYRDDHHLRRDLPPYVLERLGVLLGLDDVLAR